MNDRIRAHVAAYCVKHNWPTDDDSLIETITCARVVERRQAGQFRWWNEYRYVVEIDGMFIAFFDAEANRDESVRDLGYKFDPRYILEVRPVEVTVTEYKPVDGDE